MKIGQLRFKHGVFLLCLFFGGCSSNVLDTQFEPEISNKSDSFQFQATDVKNVTQTVQYTWQNSGTMANVNQASSLSSGSGTLTINDGDGVAVYQKNLNENGTFISATGKAGSWGIILKLSEVDGTINFRTEKRTP